MDMVTAAQFDIVLVCLDPVTGAEMQKTRPCVVPCVVISPDEMNRGLKTVLIAPMTSVCRSYKTRVPVRFAEKTGQVALDQIRAIDNTRIIKKLGTCGLDTRAAIKSVLQEMFA